MLKEMMVDGSNPHTRASLVKVTEVDWGKEAESII